MRGHSSLVPRPSSLVPSVTFSSVPPCALRCWLSRKLTRTGFGEFQGTALASAVVTAPDRLTDTQREFRSFQLGEAMLFVGGAGWLVDAGWTGKKIFSILPTSRSRGKTVDRALPRSRDSRS